MEGHVVKEFWHDGAHIRICDDCCANVTPEKVEERLRHIARQAQQHFNAAATAEAVQMQRVLQEQQQPETASKAEREMNMNGLTVFRHPNFGKVRTLEIDGTPWFVGKDVALALGYSNTKDAMAKHVDPEDKMGGVAIRDSIGREQRPILINESGMYSLIFSSKLPAAKEFKRWVTSEVLPAIRETGAYIAVDALEATLLNSDIIIRLAQELKRELGVSVTVEHAQRFAGISAVSEMPETPFHKRLVALRKERGLTQEGLGKAIGIGRSTISGYEAESKEPALNTICYLADYFGVTTDYLLGYSDERNCTERRIS